MISFNLADLIAMNALSYPDRLAIEVLAESPTSLTFSQLWERVEALADVMHTVEPGPNGTMVATLLPNGSDALLSYLGALVAGVAIVPINTRLANDEVVHILNDCGARMVLAAHPYIEMAEKVVANGPGLVSVVDTDAIETRSVGVTSPTADTDKAALPAAVFYTSGTTGSPKGAAMTSETWLLNCFRWGWQLGLAQDDVMLVPGPIFHMSFSSFALCTLLIGGSLRIMPSFDAAKACDEFTGASTSSFLVPSMTAMMLDEWRKRGRPPLSSMRTMMTSAAALDPAIMQQAFDMFPSVKMREMYGWTEAGFAAGEFKTRETVRDGTVGWATLGCEIALFDEQRNKVPQGEQGEVGVKTLAHFSGYLNRPEASAAALHDGFVISGDVGVIGPDGRLKIIDRKHGMIITGGENVYAAEVEQVVIQQPKVADVAVIGQADARWGEVISAVVVAEPGETITLQELREFCRSRLAGYKLPRVLHLRDELPRNSMGKVQRFVLKAELDAT